MRLQRKPKAPEFSHIIDVDTLEAHTELTISADEDQCKALAGRLGVLSVDGLTAHMDVYFSNGVRLHVKGHLVANVTQECVVTLEPVEDVVEEDFEAFFMKKTEAVSFAKAKRDRIVENQDPEAPFLEEEEDPEDIIDGQVDLGELVTQYLSLGLNPYPHKEGVKHDLTDEDEDIERKTTKRENPFAKLEAMKKLLKDKEE